MTPIEKVMTHSDWIQLGEIITTIFLLVFVIVLALLCHEIDEMEKNDRK